MVKMTPKLMYGPAATDLHEGINFPRMREQRAAKAREVMKKNGIPAILATGEPNVRYLTGFSWSEFQPFASYCLFFAEHDPVIFSHAGSYQQMPDQAPWIKHWRIGRSRLQDICGPEAAREDAKLFAKEIKDELKKRGLQKEKLGIVSFDILAREALKEAGLNVVEAWPLLLDASATKTKDEINCLKIASSFLNVGWGRIAEVLRPGVHVTAVRRQAIDAMAEAGATVSYSGLMSGPTTFERQTTYIDRVIEYGDLVYAPLCGTSYMGYTSCAYRSFIVGRQPTAKEKDWYKKVKERLDIAIDATRVGASTADIARAFPPASTWGYKDEAEVLSVEIGHGIGLVSLAPAGVHYNYPVVNRLWSVKYPQVIEEGMVIAYETLEGEHRVGGVRLENMVLATKNGPEVLDHFQRDQIIVAHELSTAK